MLVEIRISIWIQDMIEGFFTIARQVKLPPDIVVPPGEHNGKKLTSLAEVCILLVP